MARFAARLGRIERALGRLPPPDPARRLPAETVERLRDILDRDARNEPPTGRGIRRPEGWVFTPPCPVVTEEEKSFAARLLRPLVPAYERAWRRQERERLARLRRSSVISGVDSLEDDDGRARVSAIAAVEFWYRHIGVPLPRSADGTTLPPPG